ncbi:MAG: hypothetical protein Q8L35_04995 [Actinomycetota bacterium]|nr:hypothetical protein [Actinomycetota bacterium]
MEDFLSAHLNEKEICESCKHDYLESSNCRKCRIDKFIEKLLDSWYQQKDFKRIAGHNSIDLGELARYDLQQLFVQYFLSRLEADG